MSKSTCSVHGCERAIRARGLCAPHYTAKRRSGELARLAPVSTKERFWAKVKKTPDCWVWVGAIRETGYGAFRGDDAETVRPHRYSFAEAYGYMPDGDVDHRCGNRACVRPDHLRDADRKQNMENLTVLRSNNRSGFRGVYFGEGKWRAQVGHFGKTEYIGGFDTAEEAAEAARARRLELYTHNDRDRF